MQILGYRQWCLQKVKRTQIKYKPGFIPGCSLEFIHVTFKATIPYYAHMKKTRPNSQTQSGSLGANNFGYFVLKTPFLRLPAKHLVSP